MKTAVRDFKDAIEHLPAEAVLVLHEVSWDDYERLSEELQSELPGMRLTYDQGRLEVVSPSRRHERLKTIIDRMIFILAEELRLNLQSSGSATWKRKKSRRGAEPDLSYHIVRADHVAGKMDLDLANDPPPDLAVEVDVTSESRRKFTIYAEFGIPEIWVYLPKMKRLFVYELQGDSYVEVKNSRSFPMLDGEVLALFLERSASEDEMRILEDFRRWIHGQSI